MLRIYTTFILMSKYHKRNQPKRKRRNTIQRRSEKEMNDSIEDIFFSSEIQESYDVEAHETPFGEIITSDETIAHIFKSKKAVLEIIDMEDKVEKEDTIGKLVYYEKLYDKYPNEPYFAYEISESYRTLKKFDRAEEWVINNYKKYKGFPWIDISYVQLKYDEYEEDVTEEVFGKALNLHEIYPKFKVFGSDVMTEFYFILGMIYKDKGELDIARNCAKVIELIDFNKGLVLNTAIDFIEKPWFKWRTRIIMLLIILVILGIIGGIIWGIISLFQMVF